MIGYFITIFICLYDLRKAIKINYKQTFSDFIKIIITCLLMVGVLFILKQIIHTNDLTRFKSVLVSIIYAIVGGAIYFGITFKLGLFKRIMGFRFGRKNKDEAKS